MGSSCSSEDHPINPMSGCTHRASAKNEKRREGRGDDSRGERRRGGGGGAKERRLKRRTTRSLSRRDLEISSTHATISHFVDSRTGSSPKARLGSGNLCIPHETYAHHTSPSPESGGIRTMAARASISQLHMANLTLGPALSSHTQTRVPPSFGSSERSSRSGRSESMIDG